MHDYRAALLYVQPRRAIGVVSLASADATAATSHAPATITVATLTVDTARRPATPTVTVAAARRPATATVTVATATVSRVPHRYMR